MNQPIIRLLQPPLGNPQKPNPNQPRLHGTFVAWGAGIKTGAKPGAMNNTDVAPTMAELLGVKIPDADGRVLDAILTK